MRKIGSNAGPTLVDDDDVRLGIGAWKAFRWSPALNGRGWLEKGRDITALHLD